MDSLKKVQTLLIATVIVWLCVLAVATIDGSQFVRGAAAILAVLSTVTIWSLWALDAYGISVDGTPREKPKRDVEEDPRLALLLSLLTPDERDALQARLVDELSGEGEIMPLADLLSEQVPNDTSTGRSL